MKIKPDGVVFETTGREVYANHGTIGINPELSISQGYDGGFGSTRPALNKAEKEELSKYMIGLWSEFCETEELDD